MSKPVVLLDVDGVICDFVGAALREVESVFRVSRAAVYIEPYRPALTVDDVDQWSIAAALGLSDSEWESTVQRISAPGWAAHRVCLLSTVDAVRRLSEASDLYFVTSPWNSPTWVSDRDQWLQAHFGALGKKVIHTRHKHLVQGDVLVDDKPENIEAWSKAHPDGAAILWKAPHNNGEHNDFDRLIELVTSLENVNGE